MNNNNKLHKRHDKIFKLAMDKIEVATEFFNAHLPKKILDQVDFSTLRLEDHTFIDPDYVETEADVVYSVQLNNKKTAYLYLLCEHQSTVDRLMAFRLLGYTIRVMEHHISQNPGSDIPLVYPIVIYAGNEVWNAPLDIFPLFGELEELARETFLKPYQLLDINRTSDDELRKQQLFGIVAYALKYRKSVDFKRILDVMLAWIQLLEGQTSLGDYLGEIVLRYIITDSSMNSPDLLLEAMPRYLSPKLQGEVMTIAQQWEEQGRMKGRHEGRQEGRHEAEQLMLQRIIKRRFGEIPSVYMKKIDKANEQKLFLWADRTVMANTLEQIFSDDDED
ncbi:MAG: Rpn family recombination-promoting nuclease/putative transposase [Gammaproteobacteria bacterium]